jgi:hypothetical protein
MAASKKQVGELENAIVILEERLEKLEEEHIMMKQMISMQNALIDNLQMMVKMMSNNSSIQGYVHIGGEQSKKQETSQNVDENERERQQHNHQESEESSQRGGIQRSISTSTKHKQRFQHSLKERMLRVV